MECDTLNTIALKFETTPSKLAQVNKKASGSSFVLFPGDVSWRERGRGRKDERREWEGRGMEREEEREGGRRKGKRAAERERGGGVRTVASSPTDLGHLFCFVSDHQQHRKLLIQCHLPVHGAEADAVFESAVNEVPVASYCTGREIDHQLGWEG